MVCRSRSREWNEGCSDVDPPGFAEFNDLKSAGPNPINAGGGPMAQQVCNGATLQCSFGVAPSTLAVLPVNRVNTTEQPDANIMDHVPMVNICGRKGPIPASNIKLLMRRREGR
jgi:hypothetical protein